MLITQLYNKLFVLLFLSVIVGLYAQKKSFKPGTYILPVVVTDAKGDVSTLTTQFSLLTGLNYTSAPLAGFAPYNYFISSKDELLFMLTQPSKNAAHSYVHTYDYSSNIPTLQVSCELAFDAFRSCIIYTEPHKELYVATASGELYIVNSDCDYKLIGSIPPNGAQGPGNCIVDQTNSVLYYANQTNLVRITLPVRKVELFPLPIDARNFYDYQLLYGQTSNQLYMFIRLSTSGGRFFYSVNNKGDFSIICNNTTCNPTIDLLSLVGLDDRYMDSYGPLFLTLEGVLVPEFLNNKMGKIWNGTQMNQFWSGYSGADFSIGLYDPNGEIFIP